MLTARELHAITQKVIKDKEEVRTQQEGRTSRKRQGDAQREFGTAFPKISSDIEAVAKRGWSSCGVEIPRDDIADKKEWNPNPQGLSGIGKLIFNEFTSKNLNPVLGYGLYDQPPEYGGSLKVLFVIITWGNPDNKGNESPNINDLRHTTPLIHWVDLIKRGETRVEYPDKR